MKRKKTINQYAGFQFWLKKRQRRGIPDKERKRVPYHRFDVLKAGISPPSSEHWRYEYTWPKKAKRAYNLIAITVTGYCPPNACEYPPKWCIYSAIWLLQGWCHVKLLPSRHKFCVAHTTVHQFTVSRASFEATLVGCVCL